MSLWLVNSPFLSTVRCYWDLYHQTSPSFQNTRPTPTSSINIIRTSHSLLQLIVLFWNWKSWFTKRVTKHDELIRYILCIMVNIESVHGNLISLFCLFSDGFCQPHLSPSLLLPLPLSWLLLTTMPMPSTSPSSSACDSCPIPVPNRDPLLRCRCRGNLSSRRHGISWHHGCRNASCDAPCWMS